MVAAVTSGATAEHMTVAQLISTTHHVLVEVGKITQLGISI